jgi:hypothetical protein
MSDSFTAWFSSAQLGRAQRKLCFVYYYVIAGTCFDVTVLVWRKYTTLLPPLRLFVPNNPTVCHLSFLPYTVLAMSLIGVTFLPVVQFLPQ